MLKQTRNLFKSDDKIEQKIALISEPINILIVDDVPFNVLALKVIL